MLPSGDIAAVDPAGVGADGVLQVPDDASRVGWWTGGARAGEPFGSIVIAGHVDSREYGLGVMSELLSVQVGDELVVGDGSQTRRFQISALRQAPKARLAAETEAFRQDVDNRLVLITCVGPYDHRAGTYPDNLVVIADEVD
jgi:sortase (surface protein transpeptidase)